MSDLGFALDGAWKVLVVGLILGAGLPALFAAAIRAQAWGSGGSAVVDGQAQRHPVGTVLAALLLAVVLVGVALGLTTIVASGFGKALSFDHGYPTLGKEE